MWKSVAFDEKLLEGWERSETNSGVPYYINHNTQRTQWHHPYFIQTFDELGVMNSCRYAAYRTALKLRFIQRKFGFEDVTLHAVQTVFGRRGLGREMGTMLDCQELYIILTDLLATEQQAELALNWILNLYDPDRTATVQTASVKTALTIVSSARLSEKYRYLFQLSTDYTNQLGRKKLGALLYDLIQIPEIMNESQPFGGLNVEPAVNSCFSMVWSAAGASEDVFLAWLLREPQTLVWLPTLHRLSAAEEVIHECKCNVCKTFPIKGFRYRCLKCFNFDMCQSCFFTGRTARNHKLKHPTQEYCTNTTSKEDTKAFMKTIRNNISRKHCNKKKLRYLPIHGEGGGGGGGGGLTNLRGRQLMKEDDEDEERVRDLRYHTDHRTNKLTKLDQGATSEYDLLIQNKDTGETEKQAEKQVREKEEILRIGEDQRRELENIIEHLENENRDLMLEIQQLYQRRRDNDSISSEDVDGHLQDEYRYRHSSRRQESRDRPDSARQEVLKAHNQQLEVQLQRLRNILGAQAEEGDQPKREPLGAVSPNIPRVRDPFYKPSPSRHPYKPPPAYQFTPNRDFFTPKAQPISSTFLHGHYTAPRLSGAGVSRVDSEVEESPVDYHELLCQSFQDQSDVYSPPIPDMSYSSYEGALSRTQFSLPSAGKSQYYPDEEAELEELIDRLDMAYPGNMSHSVLGFGDSTSKEELCRAGNQIGEAFAAHVLPETYQEENYSDVAERRDRNFFSDADEDIETIRTTRVTQHQYVTQLSG